MGVEWSGQWHKRHDFSRWAVAGLRQCSGPFSSLYASVHHRPAPSLPPNTVGLQLSPRNDLRGLGEHCFKFHIFNRIGRLFRLNHPADQKVLLFGDGYHCSSLGQQQFFGIQRVHA
jgi:hypothetical protein